MTGGVVAIADIDQQKKAEAALIQNEKLAAVGRLATSISHEINNPLESVINLVYLARQGQLLPREAKEYLDSADHELARVAQIVSHTLRFYRQATKPRSLFAEELIQPTLGLYAGRLLNSGIHVQVQHRDADPVTCYEGEIRQVLNNLVGNAIEAMRAGGRLLIRSIKAHCWNTGTLGLWITVADSGHGMTKEVQARLFEAFHTTKGENGTGLGLWISRGIIDKHRGVLQVRSTNLPGRSGTVFRLFLPYNSFR